MKKILIGLLAPLILIGNTAFAFGGAGVENPNFFKKVGSSVEPVIAGLGLGSVTNPWGDIYAGWLYVSGATLGGNIDMDGYNIILDTDGDTKIANDRDALLSDDEFVFDIAGARDFKWAANLFTVLAGSAQTIEDGALQMGTATADTGTLTMIKGAQTGDPQVQFALSADALGDFSVTADTGDITLTAADDFFVSVDGNLELGLNGTELYPYTSNGSSLGTVTNMWADLFLADGGVINWNNGNYTMTHSAGLLTTNGAFTISGALSGVTTLGMSGQLTNTLADGTAPFVITSGTVVTNLNADKFDGIHAGTVSDGTLVRYNSTGTKIESGTVTESSGALGAITTLGMSGDLTMSGNTTNITHSGTTSLSVASTSGTVNVESVNFNGGAISSVSSITDGTASWATSILSGFTSISGTTLTDSVASLNAGAWTGITTLSMSGVQTRGSLNMKSSSESVADDAYIDIPDATSGWGEVFVGDNEERARFSWTTAGVVTLMENTANVDDADTDAYFCIFDNGTTVRIRNRLGSSKTVKYSINY